MSVVAAVYACGLMAAEATLEVRQTPVAGLRPHPRNPRTITPARLEHLQRVIAAEPEMLQARPLIALPDGTVIAGNQRLAAATALGWETIPCVTVDLDDDRALEWAIRDNEGFGERDDRVTAEILAELAAKGRDLDLTGMSSASIDAVLAAVNGRHVDPDDAPSPPAVAKSKLGTVYELGPHRLMCGDSTDSEHMGALMGEERASLLFTDPPYGVGYDGGTKAQRPLENDGDASIYARFLPLAVSFAEDRAPAYIWHASASQTAVAAALQEAKYDTRALIIWVKNQAQFGGAAAVHYKQKHEPCWYAVRRKSPARWYGPRNETTVWEHDRARSNDMHPTQKPVALAERAITDSSVRGVIVLDPFAGSGSTLIAAERVGRRAFCMELDPLYCDVIRRRYSDYVDDPTLAP